MDSRSKMALCALYLICASASVDAQKVTDAMEATVPAVGSGKTNPTIHFNFDVLRKWMLARWCGAFAASDEPFRGARECEVHHRFVDDLEEDESSEEEEEWTVEQISVEGCC